MSKRIEAEHALVTIEKAAVMLASSVDLAEVREVANKAAALATYYRLDKASRETMVRAQEIQARALRRAGEITIALPKRSGPGRGKKTDPKWAPGPSKTEVTKAAGWDRPTVSLAERLARMSSREFESAVIRAKADGTAKPRSVLALAKAHVSNATGNYEWYTPHDVVDFAHAVLGGPPDVDVASCAKANELVRAKLFYTAKQSGLKAPNWNGTVFGNPPYDKDLLPKFVKMLIEQWRAGWTVAAFWITNNATETPWAQLLLNNSSAVCFPKGRISFLDKTGKPRLKPLQGQMIHYFGPERDKFRALGRKFGAVR